MKYKEKINFFTSFCLPRKCQFNGMPMKCLTDNLSIVPRSSIYQSIYFSICLYNSYSSLQSSKTDLIIFSDQKLLLHYPRHTQLVIYPIEYKKTIVYKHFIFTKTVFFRFEINSFILQLSEN